MSQSFVEANKKNYSKLRTLTSKRSEVSKETKIHKHTSHIKRKHVSPLRCARAIVLDLNVYKEGDDTKSNRTCTVEVQKERVNQSDIDNYFTTSTPTSKMINKPYNRKYADIKSKYRTNSLLKSKIVPCDNGITTSCLNQTHKRAGSSSFNTKKILKKKIDIETTKIDSLSTNNLKTKNVERTKAVKRSKVFHSPRLNLALKTPQNRETFRSDSKDLVLSEEKNKSVEKSKSRIRKISPVVKPTDFRIYSNYFNSSQYFKTGKPTETIRKENSMIENDLGLDNSQSLSIVRKNSNKKLKTKVKSNLTHRDPQVLKCNSKYRKIDLENNTPPKKQESKQIRPEKHHQKSRAAYLTHKELPKIVDENRKDNFTPLTIKAETIEPLHTISQAFTRNEKPKEISSKYHAFLRFKNDLTINKDSTIHNIDSEVSPFLSSKEIDEINEIHCNILTCISPMETTDILPIYSPLLITPEVQVQTQLVEEELRKAKLKEEKRKNMTIQTDVGILTITPTREYEEKANDIAKDTNDSSNSEARESLNRQDIEIQPSFLDHDIITERASTTYTASFMNSLPKNGSIVREEQINPKDIDVLMPIGSGSFGSVFLCQSKVTKEYYALKVINKEKVKNKTLKKYAVAEKKILKMVKHPYIIKCHFYFETQTYLFLFLEHCSGKDLSAYLDEEGCFEEEKARFYICECISAINALHEKGIVYRDLKPNNIMLSNDGHIKLIDFNLSKSGFDRNDHITNSFCGSYAYMPPEIINHKDYNIKKAYEMLTGLPPYFNKNTKLIQKNIVSSKLSIPKDASSQCRDLLKKLLDKDPSRRLGANVGADEILSHPWFKGITLKDIDKSKIKTYIPYLYETPEEMVSKMDIKTKKKMTEYNQRFQKQVHNSSLIKH